jgi:hypothetical protein
MVIRSSPSGALNNQAQPNPQAVIMPVRQGALRRLATVYFPFIGENGSVFWVFCH